jgi:uncharacterized protein (DUF924 family)
VTPHEVLHFWFPAPASDATALAANDRRWFSSSSTFDSEIAGRFGAAIEQAGRGVYDAWTGTARGRLALIVLLDQLPRNAWRGTARAYAWDDIAVGQCLAGLHERADVELPLAERLFFYLPLLHAEQRTHQDLSVRCMDALWRAAGAEQRSYYAGWRLVARRQRAIVRCFGRFPHRNAVLGRRSTAAENLLLAAIGLRARLAALFYRGQDPRRRQPTLRTEKS